MPKAIINQILGTKIGNVEKKSKRILLLERPKGVINHFGGFFRSARSTHSVFQILIILEHPTLTFGVMQDQIQFLLHVFFRLIALDQFLNGSPTQNQIH